jgi:peroxiredoxin Q/BCP
VVVIRAGAIGRAGPAFEKRQVMSRKFYGRMLCLLLAGSGPLFAALPAGSVAPLFEANAALAGKEFKYALRTQLKRGPVVVYFYPSAYTNGCNLQAHTFAERADDFAAEGATIVGVSLDSISRLKEFSADPEFCAGRFPTASDADGRIAKSFGLEVREAEPGKKDTRGEEITHGRAERTTFVITSDGKINAIIGGLRPAENVAQALGVVAQLAKESAKRY